MSVEFVQSQYNHNLIQITRSNTRLHGYIPVWREMEGLTQIISGSYNFALGLMAPTTNEGCLLQGCASLKDGVINISHSPITIFAIGVLAGRYSE